MVRKDGQHGARERSWDGKLIQVPSAFIKVSRRSSEIGYDFLRKGY